MQSKWVKTELNINNVFGVSNGPFQRRNMVKRKKTVGQEAIDRLNNPDHTQTVVDTQREADKEYFDEIKKCVDTHKSWDTPYYIVVHQKKEQLLENVVRRYFLARESLPSPQWDQTVWRYTPLSGDLRFVWTLPDENTAKWMAGNPKEIPKEQHQLLAFVLEFLDKKLFKHFDEMFNKEILTST